MYDDKQHPLLVPVLLWARLLLELRSRAGGRRESGAFILGVRGSSATKARRYICYDDLYPSALESGVVRMNASGFKRLWRECKRCGMHVVADVHSHPTEWVGQSESDRTNPMISEIGHLAFIVPDYARGWRLSLSGTGIYEYRGKHRWHDLNTSVRRARVRLCMW